MGMILFIVSEVTFFFCVSLGIFYFFVSSCSDRGGSESANNTVGSGNESEPTSPSSQDGGEGTGGGREGESAPPFPALSCSTSTSDSADGVLLSRYFPGGTGATWSRWKDCPS